MNTEVDIFVAGAASGISLSFKDTTAFVDLPAGSYDFDIVPSGGTIDDTVFSVTDFQLSEGDMWSIYAAGYVSPADDTGNPFTVGAIAEDRTDIPDGNVRVQVTHAAAAGALTPVDVWVVDDACAPDTALLPGFNFGDTASVDLPTTEANLGFDVGGNGSVDACFKVPDVSVANDIVSVYAVNDDAGNVTLVAHLPDGSNAEILPSEF